jgi:hypothetical protein
MGKAQMVECLQTEVQSSNPTNHPPKKDSCKWKFSFMFDHTYFNHSPNTNLTLVSVSHCNRKVNQVLLGVGTSGRGEDTRKGCRR